MSGSACNSPVQSPDGVASTVTTTDLEGKDLYEGNLISYIRNTVRCEANSQREAQQLQQKQQQLLQQQHLRQLKRQRPNNTGIVVEASSELGPGVCSTISTSSDNTDIDHFDDFDSDEDVAVMVDAEEEDASRSTNGKTELVDIRKERNRMHAKLTRNRKKLFTNKIVEMIGDLERQNSLMRSRINALEDGRRSDTTSTATTPVISLPPPAIVASLTTINSSNDDGTSPALSTLL